MAPYVDERGDLLDLGLEWHGKMLQRIELTYTLVNAYYTKVRTPTVYEANYWYGGLISGGIGPQFGWDSRVTSEQPSAAALDAISKWVQRYRKWGHTAEGAVATLVYDQECCHVQGLCEWVACEDTVFTQLKGGAGGADAAHGGLILGSKRLAVLPSSWFNASASSSSSSAPARLLVFQTHKAPHAHLTVGAPSDATLQLVLTSPVANTTLSMSGGFWDVGGSGSGSLGAARVVVWQTVLGASGAQISRRALFGGKPVSGPLTYLFDRGAEAPHDLAPPLEVRFEKKKEAA